MIKWLGKEYGKLSALQIKRKELIKDFKLIKAFAKPGDKLEYLGQEMLAYYVGYSNSKPCIMTKWMSTSGELQRMTIYAGWLSNVKNMGKWNY